MIRFLKPTFWPKLLIGLLLVAQVALVFFLFIYFIGTSSPQVLLYFVLVIFVADIIVSTFVINSDSPTVYRLTWLFFVWTLPGLGILLYLLFANKTSGRSNARMFRKKNYPFLMNRASEEERKALAETHPEAVDISRYLDYASGGGAFDQTSLTYYRLADEAFEPLLEELRKAKHYIFMEFFIFERGKMWNSMLEILEQKAAEGVDVRVLYDDVGCLTTLPSGYYLRLRKKGIKAYNYNPLRPFTDIRMNNRDHRKILVIDGHTGFSGGFNIADEYINAVDRFGHWKDNGIMLRGKAVYNFTLMFLSTWQSASHETVTAEEKEYYRPERYIDEVGGFPDSDGYIQPYGDVPYSAEAVGERVYLKLINQAKKTLYMTTPYLIIDEEIEAALVTAAHSGVDVRLVTPHIPDKKAVFGITRSFYGKLLQAGVKIYEYTPGFVHEKTFYCDGELATVGTINMDYRSLFLHLECGTFLIGNKAIEDIRKDFEQTFEVCHQVSLDEWRGWRRHNGGYWQVLRILAPLL